MNKLIAANWKMFKTMAEAQDMVTELSKILNNTIPDNKEVLIFPPFTSILVTALATKDFNNLSIGAQDIYPRVEGAFTGEISANMIKDCLATWVLTGHSERRHINFENNEFIAKKTKAALQQGLKVVLCIGETLEEREDEQLENILAEQLSFLNDLSEDDFNNVVIAYEPVWAIGTGKTAKATDITEAHALIRNLLKNITNAYANIKILYGGSVKPENATEILNLANVNGLLVGGASLQANSFAKIILA